MAALRLPFSPHLIIVCYFTINRATSITPASACAISLAATNSPKKTLPYTGSMLTCSQSRALWGTVYRSTSGCLSSMQATITNCSRGFTRQPGYALYIAHLVVKERTPSPQPHGWRTGISVSRCPPSTERNRTEHDSFHWKLVLPDSLGGVSLEDWRVFNAPRSSCSLAAETTRR